MVILAMLLKLSNPARTLVRSRLFTAARHLHLTFCLSLDLKLGLI